MDSKLRNFVMGLFVMTAILKGSGVDAWTGEIRGRVVCDVCADSSIGPEDHVLEGLSLFLSALCLLFRQVLGVRLSGNKTNV